MRGIGFAAEWAGSGAAEQLPELLGGPGGHPEILIAPSATAAVGVTVASGEWDQGGSVAREGNLSCAFEGRLDEAAALRRQLDLGPREAPAKVIARGCARWGDDLLPRLRGEFAFVVWDDQRRRVLAARDPMGVRPLHYAETGTGISVASDVDSFLAAGLIDGEPDDGMVVQYLTRRFQSSDRTFFRGLNRIPGGHALSATAVERRVFDYRVLPEKLHTFATTRDCHEAFRERFQEAVRRRLRSKQPVVAELSGGRDSSAIVCVADQLLRTESGLTPGVVAAFAAHPGLTCDESSYVDAVERHVTIPVVRWDGTRASSLELEQPLLGAPGNRVTATGGTDGYVDVARSCGGTVVLTGLGGDQIGQPLGVALDELARGKWLAGARHAFPRGATLRERARTALAIVDAFSPRWFPPLHARLRSRPRPPSWLTSLASAAVQADPEPRDRHRAFSSHGQRIRWGYFNQPVLGMSLDMRQREAASRGLEVLAPFLDWDLVAFSLAIPPERWPPPGRLVRLHPLALRDDLPREIYRRESKADFTPALVQRLVTLEPWIQDLFHGAQWRSERYVDQGAARRLWARFREVPSSRDFESARHIWAIASVEAWLCAVLRYCSSRLGHGRRRRHELYD